MHWRNMISALGDIMIGAGDIMSALGVFSAHFILGLTWRHQKFKSTTFFTKLLHNVNNPILKHLCKFQVDIPIDPRATAVQI